MREKYIEIMEKALGVYTIEGIEEYVTSVEEKGLKEHGFPRLTANIGILMSFGKRLDLKNIFVRMMEACTLQMPIPLTNVKSSDKPDNDFSVREICCCLEAVKNAELFDDELIETWCERMRHIIPKEAYTMIAPDKFTPINNLGAFGALSEVARNRILGVDTTDFIETQIASQFLSFNNSGMFKDPNNPMVYDFVERILFASILNFSYEGEYKKDIEAVLEKSADITAKMQSVSGEVPFGGRSAQMLYNEALIAGVMEYYANFYAKKGDKEKAGEYKAGAILAQNNILKYLNNETPSHKKNNYPNDSMIGCECYAYFNKYMITVASFTYLVYLLCDDSIEQTVSVTEKGGYVVKTDDDFHKLFLNAGGYFAEFELLADFHYDANGLGRIHKKDCPSQVCLSVPFPSGDEIGYVLEAKNSRPMSICCFAETENATLYGSEKYAEYNVLSTFADDNTAKAKIECELQENVKAIIDYTVDKNGVLMELSNVSDCGFMLPAFMFDGANSSAIETTQSSITIDYCGSKCIYSFDGEILDSEIYNNRNGRYKVYKVKTNKVKIEIL